MDYAIINLGLIIALRQSNSKENWLPVSFIANPGKVTITIFGVNTNRFLITQIFLPGELINVKIVFS
jgi:hypothetical protein